MHSSIARAHPTILLFSSSVHKGLSTPAPSILTFIPVCCARPLTIGAYFPLLACFASCPLSFFFCFHPLLTPALIHFLDLPCCPQQASVAMHQTSNHVVQSAQVLPRVRRPITSPTVREVCRESDIQSRRSCVHKSQDSEQNRVA